MVNSNKLWIPTLRVFPSVERPWPTGLKGLFCIVLLAML